MTVICGIVLVIVGVRWLLSELDDYRRRHGLALAGLVWDLVMFGEPGALMALGLTACGGWLLWAGLTGG